MVRFAIAVAESAEFSGHLLERGEMAVVGIVATLVGDGMGVAEAGEGVDVGICVVAFQMAAMQPEDAFYAELGTEGVLDLHRGPLRIAVGREQAGTGSQQGAGAVHFNTAALQNHPGNFQYCVSVSPLGMQVAGNPIIQVGAEFETPGIEGEVHQFALTGRVQQGDGTVIAGPGVIAGDGVEMAARELGTGAVQIFPTGLDAGRVMAGNEHVFAEADFTGNAGKYR